jgi:hypothetical protein
MVYDWAERHFVALLLRRSLENLLYDELDGVKVFTIYFPSRFNLDTDAVVEKGLRIFGDNTSNDTSVNFWDPEDPEFSKGLEFFDQKFLPVLVFITGSSIEGPYLGKSILGK